MNAFNDRAATSNIGSKHPIQSSQYKHSREYDYRMGKPVVMSDKGLRATLLACILGIVLWGLLVVLALYMFFPLIFESTIILPIEYLRNLML
jgi:hypothetical protein